MKKKNKRANIEITLHPYAKKPWEQLTDIEKSQVFFDSSRLLDNNQFKGSYASWEQPDYDTSPKNTDTHGS